MAQILLPELFVLIFRYKYADPGVRMSRDDVCKIALLFKSIMPPGLDIWRYVDQIVTNYMNRYMINSNTPCHVGCYRGSTKCLLNNNDLQSRAYVKCGELFKKYMIIVSHGTLKIKFPGGYVFDWICYLPFMSLNEVRFSTDCIKICNYSYCKIYYYKLNGIINNDIIDFVVKISEQLIKRFLDNKIILEYKTPPGCDIEYSLRDLFDR